MLLLLLALCTTHASSWFASKKEKQPRTKPNVLVLLADDHSAEALGYRGKARLSPLVKQLNVTPHLDQLAKEGITTENAYTINALCTPARASILTGLYPSKHGATHLKPVSKGNASGIHDYVETYPEILRRNGYATALYGKYHLMSQPRGFDRYEVLLHQGSYEDPLLLNHTLSGRKWKARMKLWTRKRSDSGGSRAAGHSSDIISAKAADAVATLPRPWLIEAHFKEPHEPFHYPPRYEGLTGAPAFDASRGVWTLRGFDVAEPPTLMQRPTRCRGIDVFANRSLANSTRRRTYAQLVADYLRTLKALDDGVGRVLRRVDDENTLVLYTSDHGYFLGEHGCYDKRLMLDEAIRVPFVVREPRVTTLQRVSRYSPRAARNAGAIPGCAEVAARDVSSPLRRRRAHYLRLRRAARETRLRRRVIEARARGQEGDDGDDFILPLLRRGHESKGDTTGAAVARRHSHGPVEAYSF